MPARRRSMIACLQLRGVSARTQALDVRAGRPLAEPDRTSPDVIRAEALRPSCLSVTPVTPYARRASTRARCGLTCCCAPTLHRDWTTWRGVRAPRAHTRPVLRRREAVRRLLDGVRWPRSRVCLTTIAAWGLRLQEGTPLQGPESARLLLHVRPGTGGTDRSGPVPHRTRARRRQDRVTPRHPVLIVPAPGRGGQALSTATALRPRSRGPGACRDARHDRGLHPQASGHTRRQSWAPQVLAAGVTRRRMPASRGHRAPPPRASTRTGRPALHPAARAALTRVLAAR